MNTTYRTTVKFNLWVKYFTDRNSKVTYGNATQSALKAYCTVDYATAGVIGHKNIKKYKILALATLDQMDWSFGRLLQLGLKKVIDGSYGDWEAFMTRVGYLDNVPSKQIGKQFEQFNFQLLGEAIAVSRKERGLTL
jgi:hypothetical protein